jgi:hypothetical protein
MGLFERAHHVRRALPFCVDFEEILSVFQITILRYLYDLAFLDMTVAHIICM